MQSTTNLELLFKSYQDAFANYDIDNVSACYHLPCTLNTPEQVTLLTNQDDCQQEFGAIFSQLKDANINQILVKNASYSVISEKLYLVCIDWDFIDESGEVFADFAAIYHVLETDKTLKIINVTSHDLECTLTLSEPLKW